MESVLGRAVQSFGLFPQSSSVHMRGVDSYDDKSVVEQTFFFHEYDSVRNYTNQ